MREAAATEIRRAITGEPPTLRPLQPVPGGSPAVQVPLAPLTRAGGVTRRLATGRKSLEIHRIQLRDVCSSFRPWTKFQTKQIPFLVGQQ